MLAFVTNGRVYTMMKNREWSQKLGHSSQKNGPRIPATLSDSSKFNTNSTKL